MTTIGFIGLGKMGGNMALRYLGAGYTVYGESRDRGAVQELIDNGLDWRDTPREVTEAADVTFTSLPNEAVVDEVASGPDGILAGLSDSKVWADLSTISPAASRKLAGRVDELGNGAKMLDTPVSGSVPQVKSGTLTVMVGGDEAAYRRIEEVLHVLGNAVRVGGNGQGLVLKLAVNISLGVQMLAFAEGLLLAQRDGIDPDLAATVMTGSAIGSPMLKARVPLTLGHNPETWFDIGLMHKDIRLAREAGGEASVPLPTAAVADEVLAAAEGSGYRDRDIAALYEFLGRSSHSAG